MTQKIMYCELNSTTNPTLTPIKKAMTCLVTLKQTQQKFNEESDDDEYLAFESILLLLVRLIHGFNSRGAYWS